MNTRYRCNACGNLTRFDITITRRTRGFFHYSVGGDLSIEDEEVLAETIEDVVCRWCGTGRDVVPVEESDLAAALEADGTAAGEDPGGEGPARS